MLDVLLFYHWIQLPKRKFPYKILRLQPIMLYLYACVEINNIINLLFSYIYMCWISSCTWTRIMTQLNLYFAIWLKKKIKNGKVSTVYLYLIRFFGATSYLGIYNKTMFGVIMKYFKKNIFLWIAYVENKTMFWLLKDNWCNRFWRKNVFSFLCNITLIFQVNLLINHLNWELLNN